MSQLDGANGSEPTPQELGERIKSLMESSGKKREWLASEADISVSTINRIFNGTGEPSYIEMIRIAVALRKPLEWFATGKDDDDPTERQLDRDLRAMLTAHRKQLDRMQTDLDRVLGKAS